MFQVEWADKKKWMPLAALPAWKTGVDSRKIRTVMRLKWEEHCVECAMPDCYTSCPLYSPRADGNCARFVYGIMPDRRFHGSESFGADIEFKKWGKLEANLEEAFPLPIRYKWIGQLYDRLPRGLQQLVKQQFRQRFQKRKQVFDEIVIECYNPGNESFSMILEYFLKSGSMRQTTFRHACLIQRGQNLIRIPFPQLSINCQEGYFYLHPEQNDPPRRLVFTWLDFVQYSPVNGHKKEVGPKVKCVAWDLDNTLWKGIVSEDQQIVPDPAALALVRQLDERGILQTIVSKNDHDIAWPALQKIGLEQYFLFPAINWARKSENLRKIAGQLNIGLDTFAVIDDMPFERAEISSVLPEVRVYSEKEIAQLLRYEEFQVPVSETARSRRLSYLTEMERTNHSSAFSGTYEEFLKSCKMELDIFIPGNESDWMRCWELIQRSNQLNLSGRKYSEEDFLALRSNPKNLLLALQCRDTFGNYGIIGFGNINVAGGAPQLEDFVLSCRVAQKKVEHTFFAELANFFRAQGYRRLMVKLIITPRNGPLRKVFTELPFVIEQEGRHHTLMKLEIGAGLEFAQVMETRMSIAVL